MNLNSAQIDLLVEALNDHQSKLIARRGAAGEAERAVIDKQMGDGTALAFSLGFERALQTGGLMGRCVLFRPRKGEAAIAGRVLAHDSDPSATLWIASLDNPDSDYMVAPASVIGYVSGV
jgi:hypothetical protein